MTPSSAQKRAKLLARMRQIIDGAAGRVLYYREEDALKTLTAQIKALDKEIGTGSSVVPHWQESTHVRVTRNASPGTAVQLARLRLTRELTIRNAAGCRRTAGLSTFQARAYASRLRGRR